MLTVVGRSTFRAVADATGLNSETVRRYMQGQAPSVEFLAALCSVYDVNAQWLLTGRGPIRQSDSRAHALREANPAELLSAIAEALERLTDRVDRIELFVQTMETRVRARAAGGSIIETKHQTAVETASDHPAERARGIADAVPERPRPDAH